MRIRLKTLFIGLCLVPVVVVIGLFVARILGFINIFFEHAGIVLTQTDVATAFASNDQDKRPQLVPKITHQVFHNWRQPGNDTLPADWVQARQTCIDHNPDFKHMLWTEKTSREFIAKEYAWFLDIYDGYKFPVQRVDAVRYFLLLHYGGIYIDLDNGCLASLEPLLYYPVWITDGNRGALSNNILAARPNHPFWTLLTQSLRTYNYNYFFPYVTISYASGQWFETDVWQKYHAMLPSAEKAGDQENRLYRLIMDDRESKTWLFFTQERGGTWRNWDNKLFLLIGDHLILFILSIITLIVLAGWATLRVVRRLRRRGGAGYRRLDEQAANKYEEDA